MASALSSRSSTSVRCLEFVRVTTHFHVLEEDLLPCQWRLAVLFVQAMSCILDTKIACRKSLVALGLSPSALFAGLICSHQGQIQRLRILRSRPEIVVVDSILTRRGAVEELIHDIFVAI